MVREGSGIGGLLHDDVGFRADLFLIAQHTSVGVSVGVGIGEIILWVQVPINDVLFRSERPIPPRFECRTLDPNLDAVDMCLDEEFATSGYVHGSRPSSASSAIQSAASSGERRVGKEC